MNNEEIQNLNSNEWVLLEKLKDMLLFDEQEYRLVADTYNLIKINGCAFLSDVLQLEALDIPILEFIAISKKDSVAAVLEHLKLSTLNFYEIRIAIDEFVFLNWEES
jgi:hypothetical protein